jgi:tetratricopeptide (TPR) repeat protein
MPTGIPSLQVVVARDEAMPPLPPGVEAGIRRLLEAAVSTAGAGELPSARAQLWLGERWRAELTLGDARHAEEAEVTRGHHLLARLAEHLARQGGGAMPEPALGTFADLEATSPAALLHYLAGLGADGDERRRLWQRAFELDPAMPAARAGLAQLLLAAGHAESAAMLARGANVREPARAAELGLGLWSAGYPELALELLPAAARAQPPDAMALAALAALMAERTAPGEDGQPAREEALLLASQATQLAPEDYRTWAALADVHRARGDYAQAGFYYGFALRLAPDAAALLKNAGANWLLAREPRQALPLIERALGAAPGDGELHANLAFARHLLGEAAPALAAARQAAALRPEDARMKVLLGEMALAAGEREEALAAWARATEIEPSLTLNPAGGNLGVESHP